MDVFGFGVVGDVRHCEKSVTGFVVSVGHAEILYRVLLVDYTHIASGYTLHNRGHFTLPIWANPPLHKRPIPIGHNPLILMHMRT